MRGWEGGRAGERGREAQRYREEEEDMGKESWRDRRSDEEGWRV